MKKSIRSVILWAVDLIIPLLSFSIMFNYAMRTSKFSPNALDIIVSFLVIISFTLLVYYLFRINTTIWRYCTERDYIKVFIAAAFASGGASALFIFTRLLNLEWQYYVFAVLIDASVAAFSRVIYRLIAGQKNTFDNMKNNHDEVETKRLLIVGAGSSASIIIGDIRSNPSCGYKPVALVDDDITKIGRTVKGIDVVGSISEVATAFITFSSR